MKHQHETRFGVLASPETFAKPCPWCRKTQLVRGECKVCRSELRCSGFGHVHDRFRHSVSCMEVACDLRYLPEDFDWGRVLENYRDRGLDLDANKR